MSLTELAEQVALRRERLRLAALRDLIPEPEPWPEQSTDDLD